VGARPPWRVALAGAGGLALGACLMLSYGLVLLAPIALAAVGAAAVRAVPRGRHRWRAAALVLATALAGVALVLGVFAAAGFWWPDGLAVAAQRVRAGGAWLSRPAAYFVFANPAALAIVVGPATVAAVPALSARTRPAWLLLPAAALCAVALAIASNLSKGEVERIYLPFAVWLLPLCGLLRDARTWFAANLALAVLLAATTNLGW
jgi:methylthioxylose transferase